MEETCDEEKGYWESSVDVMIRSDLYKMYDALDLGAGNYFQKKTLEFQMVLVYGLLAVPHMEEDIKWNFFESKVEFVREGDNIVLRSVQEE